MQGIGRRASASPEHTEYTTDTFRALATDFLAQDHLDRLAINAGAD